MFSHKKSCQQSARIGFKYQYKVGNIADIVAI